MVRFFLPVFLLVYLASTPAYGNSGGEVTDLRRAQVLNFNELFKGLTDPLVNFSQNLTRIGEENIRGFFSGLDNRFREITGGLGIIQALRALLGIFIWFFKGVIKFLSWLRLFTT